MNYLVSENGRLLFVGHSGVPFTGFSILANAHLAVQVDQEIPLESFEKLFEYENWPIHGVIMKDRWGPRGRKVLLTKADLKIMMAMVR